MKATKEVRAWVKRLVKCVGNKNGVVRSCWFDSPDMDRKMAKNKRLKKNQKFSLEKELEYNQRTEDED